LLDVLSIPFEKEKSSDELTEVKKMIYVLDGLCDLIMFEVPLEQDPEGTITSEWELARMEIANTLNRIASIEAEEVKNMEPTEEDKMIYGAENASPLQRLYKNGNRNLKAVNQSIVPHTLVSLLTDEAVRRSSTDTMISVLEALTAISIYQPITEKIIAQGVGRDLVRIIN